MKRLTLRKIINAIRKAKKQEEIPWGVGAFYNAHNLNGHDIGVGASCALGLALRGLGYAPNTPPGIYDDYFSEKGWELALKISKATGLDMITLNDSSKSFDEMIVKVETLAAAKNKLDTEFTF